MAAAIRRNRCGGGTRWIIGGGAQDNEGCVRAMSQGNAIITLLLLQCCDSV